MRKKTIIKSILFVFIIFGCIPPQEKKEQIGDETTQNESLGVLVESLIDEDPTVRASAAHQLGKIGHSAETSIPYLAQALGDEDRQVRSAAALALYRIGPSAIDSVPMLNKEYGYTPVTPEIARQAFDQLGEIVAREYPMFIIRPEVDWDELREVYRPEAAHAKTSQELAIIIAEMLSQLRDLHVWVKVKGKNIPVYSRPVAKNMNQNTNIYSSLIGQIQQADRWGGWAKTEDNIGFIFVLGWKGANLPDQVDDILEEMRDTRGLILDLRWNSGGDAQLAEIVTGRFVDTTLTYAYYQYHNGPDYTDLTEKIPRKIAPRGPWQYDRPVILLMGQTIISAGESSCAMMSACPQVTTMGDHTRGSTGFPIEFSLPAGIQVSIPQWIAYLPDGQPFDERGVEPDVLFEPTADSFTGDRDDLVSAALERLRQAPQPAAPIAGPTVQEYREEMELERAVQPKVVSLQPGSGAVNVESTAQLRIRFDRSMRPSTIHLQWQDGGFHECGPVGYDEATNEFIIPIHLESGCKHRILINPLSEDGMQYGFQSVRGVLAAPYEWTFTTKSDSRSGRQSEAVAQAEAGRDAAALRSVIEKFNLIRRGMNSFVETINTIEYASPGPSGFTSLRSYGSTFKIQSEEQFYADVTDIAGSPLEIFSEGKMNHICGYYQKTEAEENLVFAHVDEISEQKIEIADPFNSKTMDAESLLRQQRLQCGGTAEVGGRECYVVNSWAEGSSGEESSQPTTRFWIDRENNLLLQMTRYEGSGTQKISRFAYDNINETLPFLSFLPEVPYQLVVSIRKMAEPIGEGYKDRFVEIQDGSSGHVSAQFGRYGTQGRIGIGLK